MSGPLNGVPWSTLPPIPGAAALLSASERNYDYTADDYKGIVVPTMLQTASDVVNYWTSLTCLYDRYWTAEEEKITLPICLFHVTKITPTRQIDVSKKRVLLYEAQDNSPKPSDKADTMRPSVMQTIVDNAVKQPTTYTMDIIVPFQPIGRYISEGVKTISDMIVAVSDLFGGDTPGGFTDWWEGIFSSVFSLVKAANTVSQIAGKLPSMDGASFINMNSLEAMADNCRVLCMKMWTGYEYKYVMITGMTYDKQSKEDDVFRASLSLQEVPVLTISEPKPLTAHATERNWKAVAVSAVQSAFISPLLAFTGVKTAAQGGESGLSMIKKAIGSAA